MKVSGNIATIFLLFVLSSALSWNSCNLAFANGTTPQAYTFQVVHEYPHDKSAFTQGLLYDQGFLYESTGLYGKSSLRLVRLENGKTLLQKELAAPYFGEGLALLHNKVFLLTWKSRTGFIYDPKNFDLIGRFGYPSQGWGLTVYHGDLVLSDGSDCLRFLDANTFVEKRRILVKSGGKAISRINELELVNEHIFANIWRDHHIAIIDPKDGRVTAWIDLGKLAARQKTRKREAVLNGIAYDEKLNRLFVTGKWWTKIYQIKLIPAE